MSRDPSRSLSELARELLRAERTESEPEALKQRALARARLALEAERPSRIEIHSAFPVAPGLRRKPMVRVALVAAAVAVAGVAAASADWWQTPASVAPMSTVARPMLRAVPVSQLAARSSQPRQAVAPVSPLPVPSARGAAPLGSAAPAEAGKPPIARQYALELSVLEPARSAIARGDYAAALTAAARHQREFANGLLAEERSALQVRALWGLGRIAEADAAAALFRQRYPRSALLAWMRQKQNP